MLLPETALFCEVCGGRRAVEMVKHSETVLPEFKRIRLFGKVKAWEGGIAAWGYLKTCGEGILPLLWNTKLGLIVKEVQGIERLW